MIVMFFSLHIQLKSYNVKVTANMGGKISPWHVVTLSHQ